MVHRIVRPNGEIRWVHELADFNDNDKNTMLVGTVRDITQQKIYELDLERLSLTDELTGAYNRRYCYNRLDQLLGSAVKRGFQWLWPCLISIFSKRLMIRTAMTLVTRCLSSLPQPSKEIKP